MHRTVDLFLDLPAMVIDQEVRKSWLGREITSKLPNAIIAVIKEVWNAFLQIKTTLIYAATIYLSMRFLQVKHSGSVREALPGAIFMFFYTKHHSIFELLRVWDKEERASYIDFSSCEDDKCGAIKERKECVDTIIKKINEHKEGQKLWHLIHGQSRLGKSTLLEVLADQLSEGYPVYRVEPTLLGSGEKVAYLLNLMNAFSRFSKRRPIVLYDQLDTSPEVRHWCNTAGRKMHFHLIATSVKDPSCSEELGQVGGRCELYPINKWDDPSVDWLLEQDPQNIFFKELVRQRQISSPETGVRSS